MVHFHVVFLDGDRCIVGGIPHHRPQRSGGVADDALGMCGVVVGSQQRVDLVAGGVFAQGVLDASFHVLAEVFLQLV